MTERKTYGAWTRLGREKREKRRSGRGNTLFWECECRCGTVKWVRASQLKNNTSTCCGCIRPIKHGKCDTPEYHIWATMLARCRNPSSDSYYLYGEQGVTVCTDWLRFENFLRDMGPRPSPELSIERKNNDGNYELLNCRWATAGEQSRNTCRTKLFTIAGKTLCMKDWAKDQGMVYTTLQGRLRRGLSIEAALNLPLQVHKPRRNVAPVP